MTVLKLLTTVLCYVISDLPLPGVCPLLCNSHGDYRDGRCECHPGWKGRECSLRHEECEVSDCNGHGRCQQGRCICARGFTGEFCEKGERVSQIDE